MVACKLACRPLSEDRHARELAHQSHHAPSCQCRLPPPHMLLSVPQNTEYNGMHTTTHTTTPHRWKKERTTAHLNTCRLKATLSCCQVVSLLALPHFFMPALLLSCSVTAGHVPPTATFIGRGIFTNDLRGIRRMPCHA